jgi:hypothetical protein
MSLDIKMLSYLYCLLFMTDEDFKENHV